jgi:hypothetical protein
MRKLHYLLLVLFLVAMTGCGASNGTTAATAGNGSLAAKLVWGTGTAGKALAKTVASVPVGIAKIRLTVSGANVPVVRNEILLKDDVTQGSVSGIYPGTVTLVVQALDSAGVVKFEGFAFNVVVAANSTTDVGTVAMTAPVVKASEVQCLGCHETTIDTTGQNLIADYKASGHYTNLAFTDANNVGAGCVGCHGPSHNVPNPFFAGSVIAASPLTASRCFDCHADKISEHFNAQTGAVARPAMFVATNYVNNCNACHQAHNAGVADAERVAWANSAHGDVNGAAWASEDMQQPGQVACQRCHTATGFKNFAISNFTAMNPTTSVGSATDSAREVLACDACHSNNNFDVRTVGAFTAPYTLNNVAGATITFPNVGESNLCIACHSARENGVSGVADFTNASFKNSHYLGAAAVMYLSAGFINFTSGAAVIGSSTYAKTLTADNVTVPGYGISGGVSSTHRKLGTALINGDNHNPAVFIAGQFDANGPCVVCHMNANGAPSGTRDAHGHTLAIDANAYNQVCKNCHTSENTVPLTGANFQANFLEGNSSAFQSTLALAVSVLKTKYNIEYDAAAYPYFFKGGLSHVSANAVKDWTLGSANQVFGKKLMGACFNIQLLTKDPAAYAHGRSYSRRLLYDSIDFLDDGAINLSVGATALASGLVDANSAPLFTKGTAAYNASSGAITTVAAGTSEAMLYLIGWNRTTGAWTAPERP